MLFWAGCITPADEIIREGDCPSLITSCQTHSVGERNNPHCLFCQVEHVKEPLKLLLENILALSAASISKLRKKRIQTWLCGRWLITTIKQFEGAVINLGNLVTMQEYSWITCKRQNLSVARLPALALFDSGNHLGFDLTHGVSLCLWLRHYRMDWGGLGEVCDSLSIVSHRPSV